MKKSPYFSLPLTLIIIFFIFVVFGFILGTIDIQDIGQLSAYRVTATNEFLLETVVSNHEVELQQAQFKATERAAISTAQAQAMATAMAMIAAPSPTLISIYLQQSETPNPMLQAGFEEVDKQFSDLLKGNIAFNKPSQMKKDKTASIELILSPLLAESALAAQVVERGGFVTNTAEPNVLIAPNGETVTVQTSQIEITPRMKAVLLSRDHEAFFVKDMHDNPEQIVSSVETTIWRWSVTAKKEGLQTLELVIYQLVKYDGREFWHEVETYKANIVVEVTMGDRIKSLDWYWIAGFIVTLIGAIFGIWKWLEERKKKPGVMQVKIVDEKKSPPKKKK